MTKQKELKPELIEVTNTNIPNLEEIKSLLGKNTQLTEIKNSGVNGETDNFFRVVIKEFLNDDNISLKTEYLNVNENFSGAKLEFLSKYANMPILKDFIHIFETKRVSLERKSRIELIKAFEKRDEEIQSQNRIQNIKELFGM